MTPSRPHLRVWIAAAVWLLTSAAAALALIPPALEAPALLTGPETRVWDFEFVDLEQRQCSQQVSRGPPSVTREHTYFVGESGVWVHNDCRKQLLDNNILSTLDSKDRAIAQRARTFASRNRGKLAVTRQIREEFVSTRSEADFEALARRFSIQTIDIADDAVNAVRPLLNKKVSFNDASAFAAAKKFDFGLVTGDRSLFNSSFRNGITNLKFRQFDGDFIPAIKRTRRFLKQEKVPDVNAITGSPRKQ